jgi:hypothetical protein
LCPCLGCIYIPQEEGALLYHLSACLYVFFMLFFFMIEIESRNSFVGVIRQTDVIRKRDSEGSSIFECSAVEC